jgi:hypothetical protein
MHEKSLDYIRSNLSKLQVGCTPAASEAEVIQYAVVQFSLSEGSTSQKSWGIDRQGSDVFTSGLESGM